MKGRPKIYTDEELRERQKVHQKRWYEKNKDKIQQKYNPEVSKVQREIKKLKGYYIIYNDELRQQYIGFSKNVISRISTIISGIRIQDTKLHKKFNPDVKWKWRMICFCEEQNEKLLDKCEYFQQDYISLNDKLIISK
jgi:hypothetical protein